MSTEYAVENGWLVEVVNEHTCGAGVGSMPHEPGCGLVPIARIEDLLAAAHPAPAESSEGRLTEIDCDAAYELVASDGRLRELLAAADPETTHPTPRLSLRRSKETNA